MNMRACTHAHTHTPQNMYFYCSIYLPTQTYLLTIDSSHVILFDVLNLFVACSMKYVPSIYKKGIFFLYKKDLHPSVLTLYGNFVSFSYLCWTKWHKFWPIIALHIPCWLISLCDLECLSYIYNHFFFVSICISPTIFSLSIGTSLNMMWGCRVTRVILPTITDLKRDFWVLYNVLFCLTPAIT